MRSKEGPPLLTPRSEDSGDVEAALPAPESGDASVEFKPSEPETLLSQSDQGQQADEIEHKPYGATTAPLLPAQQSTAKVRCLSTFLCCVEGFLSCFTAI